MSREPIIVDGVDVSGCVYRAEEKCILKDDECCFFPNCDYKNWQRKEQEYEEFKKEFDKTHQLMLKKQVELVKEILKNDQLEAELKDMTIRKIDYLKESLLYKLTLQEIKELAEQYQKDYLVNNGVILLCNQILQKCEVLKDE